MALKAPQSVSPNVVFFVVTALFIVWMQRNGRWKLLVGAMDGSFQVRTRA
jgi:hypothetical protein